MNGVRTLTIEFWYHEYRHRLKYFGKKYRPKSPLEVYNTIVTFQFGLENYDFKKGRYVRKKVKNAAKKLSQPKREKKTGSTETTGDTQQSDSGGQTGETGKVCPPCEQGKEET